MQIPSDYESPVSAFEPNSKFQIGPRVYRLLKILPHKDLAIVQLIFKWEDDDKGWEETQDYDVIPTDCNAEPWYDHR